MKIWLTKNSEVPVREQIVAQITIGITSGDLPAGEKLPSTQEIARRFQIHPNTVSNAYQKLAGEGWVEFRKGSGFFVCQITNRDSPEAPDLRGLIADFFEKAGKAGFSESDVCLEIEKYVLNTPPERILVIDSDPRLREILLEEIRESTGAEVRGTSFDDFKADFEENYCDDPDTIFTALKDEMAKVKDVLPTGRNCIFLTSRSVSESMTGQTRPNPDDLIGVVSGWETFLLLAKTMLLAAEVEGGALIVRSTDQPNWQKGLKHASLIICDVLTAKSLPDNAKVREFRIIADSSLNELRESIRPVEDPG